MDSFQSEVLQRMSVVETKLDDLIRASGNSPLNLREAVAQLPCISHETRLRKVEMNGAKRGGMWIGWLAAGGGGAAFAEIVRLVVTKAI